MTGNTPLVPDNGTGMFKLGYAHERFPRAVLPTLLGTPKYPCVLVDELADHIYVGQEALNRHGVLTLSNPMKQRGRRLGRTSCLCEYIFSKDLNVDKKEQSLLVTVSSFLPATQRGNLVTIFFETFEVPALYIIDQALLALYASGRTTGLVIDYGEGSTCIISVYETYYISAATCCHMAAGNTVTQHLKCLLPEIGCRMYTSAEHEIAREIKERTCYVAMDYQEALKIFLTGQIPPEVYSLSDGRHLRLISERFRAPEVLFSPNLFGLEFQGITSLITGYIDRCPTDLH
ncbi:Actin [Opisthorchis viverrini]|uniref:Actin n=2 Tax=Opisthorchis viverrini TaxID=6198 RepID=A0A1S8X3M6_OPIVI|nr:hypothetical protein T265_07465 [Opisthorchis viverrini]KER25014.1 hypothetical protein T265_07465 [Opisthorchis viverrini]OON21083.1 Actin [Opisthorchis viverrini]